MPMLIINEKEQKKPVFTVKTVTANGTYNAFEDNADGYSSVIVDTPVKTLTTKNISANGNYKASSDNADGYSEVTVDVEPNVGTKNISANGTYNASSDNLDGYSSVTVDVQTTLISKSITANGNYSASADNADGYSSVSVDVPLPSNAYLLKSIEHESIATFTDGTDNFLKSLEVAIEPQQDLHGYDSPWVGGAGKNKFKIDSHESGYGITNSFIYDSDNNIIGIKSEGTSTVTSENAFFLIGTFNLSAGNYVLNGGRRGTGGAIAIEENNTTIALSSIDDVSFTLENEASIKVYIRVNPSVPTTNSNFYPMVRLASVTDPTFAPYSNICPIIGWSAVDVSVSGINVWDEETKSGYYDVLTGSYVSHAGQLCCKDYISVRPNMTLYGYKGSYTSYGELLFYDCNHDYIGYLRYTQWINKEFTIPSNCYYITFNLGSAYGATYKNDISINYPSTDTEYHAYNGSTITIQLGDTYYGGKLDVVNGVLTLTDGFISSYNGETLPSTWISDRDVYAEGTTPTIGAEVVYELATPQTIQLTPTIIKSLQGDNNFFADSGEIELLQYWGKETA